MNNTTIDGQFCSARFYYDPVDKSDEAVFIALYLDPQVMQKIMPVMSSQQAAETFAKLFDNPLYQPATLWKIHCQSTNALIGVLGFMAQNKPSEAKRAEIGIMLKPDFGAKGVASESLLALLHYGFTALELKHVFAYFNHNNTPIERIANRLGFSITPCSSDLARKRCEIDHLHFLTHNPLPNPF